ncbi:YhcN/YlaJ family sporulation lipoprotein [Evansella clarkii]|uniref:YhcN/YlaJ family sporulation lipoprotein n=1 Tax=Evansella clarkii TaxID=79879 RepID=UPI00099631B6|nr:YhcN/YlaJ family sporulation lipoprotein [Evansella clarkii]
MKKIALSLTAASMLLTGLAGCGDVNDAGMNDTQSGYNQGRGYGNQTGLGVNQRETRSGTLQHGYTTERGVGQGTGQGRGYGTMQGGGAGQGTGMGGLFGKNAANRNDGTGFAGNNRGFGSENRGMIGQNNNQGFGRGITGDDRPGMVDEDGILNGRFDRDTTRGQSTGRQHRGLMNRGTGQGDELSGLRGQNRMQGNGRTIPRGGNVHGQQDGGYYNGEDGRLARRIENTVSRMDAVDDCSVIVNGDDVIVGVDADGRDGSQLDDRIRSKVKDISDDLDVHVVTDEDQVRDVRGMNDRLRAGEPFEEIGATFEDMLQDLGRAVQRPFERSR